MARLHYLDNLRWACILLLFPCHAAFVFGPAWYIYYVQSAHAFEAAHFIMTAIFPWILPLLFCIAGMTTCFALRKRTPRGYLDERVRKLLIPFLAGVVLICPVVAYFGRKFHTGTEVSFPSAVVQFFGSLTSPDIAHLDRMGGDFSVGHLWFIIFLFIISVLALGLVLLWRNLADGYSPDLSGTGLPAMVLLFIPVWLLNIVSVTISMYSFFAYFALFLVGYCLLSQDPVQARLEEHRHLLLAAWVLLTVGVTWGYGLLLGHNDVLWGTSPAFVLTGWVGVLALLGTGRHLLEVSSPATEYLTAASYPVYIIHQAVLVPVAYYILLMPPFMPALQYSAVILISLVLTFGIYEVIRRVPYIRALFGITLPEKNLA
jgi:glucans biosynthesis protein C